MDDDTASTQVVSVVSETVNGNKNTVLSVKVGETLTTKDGIIMRYVRDIGVLATVKAVTTTRVDTITNGQRSPKEVENEDGVFTRLSEEVLVSKTPVSTEVIYPVTNVYINTLKDLILRGSTTYSERVKEVLVLDTDIVTTIYGDHSIKDFNV